MKDLIEVNNGELTVSSLKIAELYNREHSHVTRSIEGLIKRGRIFKNRSPRIVGIYLDAYNREQKYYNLSERDFLIAMPFIGGDKSEEGQEALVDAYLALQPKKKLRKINTKYQYVKESMIAKVKCHNRTLSLGRFESKEEMEEWKAEFRKFFHKSDEMDIYTLRDQFYIKKTGSKFKKYRRQFRYKK